MYIMKKHFFGLGMVFSGTFTRGSAVGAGRETPTGSAFPRGFSYFLAFLGRFAPVLLHPGQTLWVTTWRSSATGTPNGCGLTKTKSWKNFHQKRLKTFWEKLKKLFRKKHVFSSFFLKKSKFQFFGRKSKILDFGFFSPRFSKKPKKSIFDFYFR
jgi:hypothetical protein